MRTLIAPEHPLNLAALRISVTALVLASPETTSAKHWAALPAALRSAPEGLGWAAQSSFITPELASAVEWVLIASALTGLVGLFSKTSLFILTISGLYVFGISQLTGSVTHDMHLFWFSALLAVSPCGAALSVDRFFARRRGVPEPGPSIRIAVPLTAVRILLGLVYFFPGFWKLRESGLSWVFSENLRSLMYWKWYQNGGVPWLRVDHWEGVIRAGALGVVLLELGFPFLVLYRKTRLVAAAGGLAFHLLSQVFLFIPFISLWGCYTALVDWGKLSKRVREPEPAPRLHSVAAPAALGVVLCMAVAIAGARNATQAWPFACYPTFQWKMTPEMPDLVLEAVQTDGTTRVLPDGPGGGGFRTQAEWGLVWRTAGLYGDPVTPERLEAYWLRAMQKPAVASGSRGADVVRVYRAWYSVVPEHRGRAPLRAELLGTVTPR